MEYCSGGSLRDKIATNTFTATEANRMDPNIGFSLRLIHKRE
jgi:hypothetical protein